MTPERSRLPIAGPRASARAASHLAPTARRLAASSALAVETNSIPRARIRLAFHPSTAAAPRTSNTPHGRRSPRCYDARGRAGVLPRRATALEWNRGDSSHATSACRMRDRSRPATDRFQLTSLPSTSPPSPNLSAVAPAKAEASAARPSPEPRVPSPDTVSSRQPPSGSTPHTAARCGRRSIVHGRAGRRLERLARAVMCSSTARSRSAPCRRCPPVRGGTL